MTTQFDRRGFINRRELLSGAAAAGAMAFLNGRLPAAAAFADATGAPGAGAAAPAAKPGSVINGVRIGCITYSYRGGINTAEDTLKALLQDGLSEVELMDGPIRAYTGISGGRGPGSGR